MSLPRMPLCAVFLAWAACSAGEPTRREALVVPDACDEREAGLVCREGVAFTCLAGDVASEENCAAQGLTCSTQRGCEACRPNHYECDGSTLLLCAKDGRQRELVMECPEGTTCGPHGCADLCAQAAADRSYIGCDYWAAFTLNSQLDPVFRPAVVIGNPQYVAAHVRITKAGVLVAEAEVPAGSARTLVIPVPNAEPLRAAASTVLARQAAYHVVADVPVIAHQFNPLLFEVDQECAILRPGEDHDDNRCNSFTNDASLLLPSHVLTREDKSGIAYLGVSRATFIASQQDERSGYAGFLALVAVGDRPVRATIRASAYTQAGDEIDVDGELVPFEPTGSELDGGSDAGLSDAGFSDAAGPADDAGLADAAAPPPDAATLDTGLDPLAESSSVPASAAAVAAPERFFPPLAPGETRTITLEPGDVLQLLSQIPPDCPFMLGMSEREGQTVCDPGALYDLTGTLVEADGPLMLLGGHDCTYVPFDQVACDHLEETLFPLETWGQRVIVGRPSGSSGSSYRLRVLSAADDNEVRFEPALSAPVVLDRGAWIELEAAQSVLVTGTRPLLVAQYLEGQGAVSLSGDPSLTLVPPVEQYRDHYNFLSPESYTHNFVTVIAPDGETVVLDGDTVLGFEPIGDTGYAIATVELERAGEHELFTETGVPIGITLYGFGAFTSYMLPGGLDLHLIADLF